MKNKKSATYLYVTLSLIIVLFAAVVILNLKFQNKETLSSLLIKLLGDLLSALIIGFCLGSVTKIITNNLFSIELNMKKLRDFGIQGIGTGKSDDSDIRKMFGHNLPKKRYPNELKLLFLTGNSFLNIFKNQIIKCLDEGTQICLLITSPTPENLEYLKRCSFKYSDGKVDYVKEIYEDSLVSAQEIINKTKNPDNFKIRFYLDEYQNNIRISKYCLGSNKERTYYWINVQPLTKPAKDLSIALKGTIETDYSKDFTRDENKDICLVTESGFNKLWDKYELTEYVFTKAEPTSEDIA